MWSVVHCSFSPGRHITSKGLLAGVNGVPFIVKQVEQVHLDFIGDTNLNFTPVSSYYAMAESLLVLLTRKRSIVRESESAAAYSLVTAVVHV